MHAHSQASIPREATAPSGSWKNSFAFKANYGALLECRGERAGPTMGQYLGGSPTTAAGPLRIFEAAARSPGGPLPRGRDRSRVSPESEFDAPDGQLSATATRPFSATSTMRAWSLRRRGKLCSRAGGGPPAFNAAKGLAGAAARKEPRMIDERPSLERAHCRGGEV